MNDQRLDRAIRAALNDVVATAPRANDVPVGDPERVAPGRRDRPVLAIATALTAAAGIIAVVVVTTRSTINTDFSRPSVPVVTSSTTAPTTTAVPSTSTTVAPTPGPLQRVEFRSGTSNASIAGEVVPGTTDRYVLEAGAGQTMIVHVDAAVPDLAFSIFAPDGSPLAEDEVLAAVELPADGDYIVEVRASVGGPYEVNVLIS
jgi:hypothetical protein